ncbi:MerR family transcriptional regulator [Streptomyces sp. N35]|uniref:MerR family transcriptional regulator n=1 Tax=Streptomyces sp. N35 TaxID=2795730 RepID=UPI0018F4614E|nr:MerR family transcriptional regulator [Streptomyces sp. N35]
MHEELLTIGRFARLCRLSVKQLRHYDEIGLLAPVRVDPATGYRYYTADQARDALTIALLRELDLPLAVIGETLATAEPDVRAKILRSERDRLAARIRRDQGRLRMLTRVADGLPSYEVTLAREPARHLAVVRATCAAADVGKAVGECVGRLVGVLGAVGVGWTPPLWGLYPLDLEERVALAVGAEVVGAGGAGLGGVGLDGAGLGGAGLGGAGLGGAGLRGPGLDVEVLAGGVVLSVLHTGAYAELPLAYHALFAAVQERGLTARGPVREAYLVGPGDEVAVEEYRTRLVVAVESGEAVEPGGDGKWGLGRAPGRDGERGEGRAPGKGRVSDEDGEPGRGKAPGTGRAPGEGGERTA